LIAFLFMARKSTSENNFEIAFISSKESCKEEKFEKYINHVND